jgi:hypothetical protein
MKYEGERDKQRHTFKACDRCGKVMRSDKIKKHQETKTCIENAVATLRFGKSDLHQALRVLRRAGFAKMGSLMVCKRKVSISHNCFIDEL